MKVEKYTVRGIRIARDADSRIEGLMNYAGIIKWRDGTLWTKESMLQIYIIEILSLYFNLK